jgi:hypothetical protein
LVPLGSQLLLSFDQGAVSGALVTSQRVVAFAQVALSPGALDPHPLQRNLHRPEEVRDALRAVARDLQAGNRPATLLLPDGIARTLLLDLPPGADAAAFARFRIGPSLPYPPGEAVIDVLASGAGRGLAGAVRRSVVEEYEQAASAAGWTQDRVDLTPLAALAALARTRPPGPTLDVVLGDVAVSFAAGRGERLEAFRTRRRDPVADEPLRIREDVARTLRLAGYDASATVRVVGRAAGRLMREMGAVSAPGWSLPMPRPGPDAFEAAWLGAAFA